MRKYKQKEIRNLVADGIAEDITTKYEDIKESVDKVGYSIGVYGLNGGVLKGCETGKLYAITCRSTALSYFF